MDILKLDDEFVIKNLSELLKNKSTGKNLLPENEVKNLKPRSQKSQDIQSLRTRQTAEVFSPACLCKKMIDVLDDEYKNLKWQNYINLRCIEIACGEAPFIISRYDAETGQEIEIENRVGILDRKLKVINENVPYRDQWFKFALQAFRSVYGYELQADSLMIARLNLLLTFVEYHDYKWKDFSRDSYFRDCLKEIVDAIAWNFWQMNGLETPHDDSQISLFEVQDSKPKFKIRDWQNNIEGEFTTMSELEIKFDFCVSNPPYQDDVKNQGDRANPLYHKFMDAAFELADKVEFVTPARFLFNAGQTPKAWNEKMLNDPHFKVLMYEPDSKKIFRNSDIKGGVVVTYRNNDKYFGAIGAFSPFPELNSILHKVRALEGENSAYLDSVVSSQGLFKLTDLAISEHPEIIQAVGQGTGKKIVSIMVEKLPEVFVSTPPSDKSDSYLKILGRVDNRRVYKYIKRSYVVDNDYIDAYKVFAPEANGTRAIGEILSTPLIGEPLIGVTDTFICIGCYDNLIEAENTFKYIKTKFARAMLGILKVTQHNPRAVWRYIPLQNFKSDSDIDWSKTIREIDEQLYAKYKLDKNEIEFIETHVREMK